MADVDEDVRWDLEFDKVKDKDNLGLIMEDSWNFTDDILVNMVQELFDSRTPLSAALEAELGLEEVNGDDDDDDALVSKLRELFDFPTPIAPLSDDLMELQEDVKGLKRKLCHKDEEVKDRGDECLRRKRVCGDVKGLKRKLCDKNEKEEDRGGECLRRKRVCDRDRDAVKKSNDVRELSYVDKLEKVKRKLREGYDSYSRNRKTSQVLSLNEVGLKGKSKKVVTTMKGKSNQKNVCKDGANKDVIMVVDEKKRLNEVFKFSYAERVEMAKAKLQQRYDRCASERKKTCVISLEDIPKPAKKTVGGFKGRHSIPVVSKTISGY